MARYKLIFRSQEHLRAATAIETAGVRDKVMNEKRRSLSVEVEEEIRRAGTGPALGFQTRSPLEAIAQRFDARIVEDFQYDLEARPEFQSELGTEAAEASLDEVISMIGADKAHADSWGEDVTIAVVDTGVDGSHPEFAHGRRVGGWAPIGEDPWTDWEGHGTMCMTIAGASREKGARYLGVAPGAGLMSCRTGFFDSELAAIYDDLAARARAGERIVASNSFGLRRGTPPQPPGAEADFPDALNEAIAAGVLVVFSAGNNHELAGGRPDACAPNTIWIYKSRDDLLSVATCDLERKMWFYSSRGPGQHHGQAGMNEKPDVTAPTPRNGKILYGAQERVLQNGWGTSGACPQVAGLAALIWSRHSRLASGDVMDVIRNTASDLGFGPHCQGRGLIDCQKALQGVVTS